MAWDPCVSCGREFNGATSHTYVTWHIGDGRYAFRLRQCASCAAEIRNSVAEVGDKREENGDWTSALGVRFQSGSELERTRARANSNGHVERPGARGKSGGH